MQQTQPYTYPPEERQRDIQKALLILCDFYAVLGGIKRYEVYVECQKRLEQAHLDVLSLARRAGLVSCVPLQPLREAFSTWEAN